MDAGSGIFCSVWHSKMSGEKAEIRIKVPKWIVQELKEHCDHFGVNLVSTITPLLVEYLGKASRVRDISFGNLNNSITHSSTSGGKAKPKVKVNRGSQIPADFSPPKSIAEEQGLDYDLALSFFIDWARGKGHTQKDWIATFRTACRSWLKERLPQKSQEPKVKYL